MRVRGGSKVSLVTRGAWLQLLLLLRAAPKESPMRGLLAVVKGVVETSARTAAAAVEKIQVGVAASVKRTPL